MFKTVSLQILKYGEAASRLMEHFNDRNPSSQNADRFA